MKINRIILFGYDINKLKLFYQTNFNLHLIEEIENEWLVFDAEGIEIAFHLIGEGYRTKPNFRVESNFKIVFNVDDLVGFRAQLINNGVKMGKVKSFEGFDFIICDGEDFEGNVFQLSQKKA